MCRSFIGFIDYVSSDIPLFLGLPGMARRAASSDPKKAHKATPPAPDVPFPRKGEGKYKGKSKHEQKSVSSPDLQSPQTPPSSSIPAVKGETKKIMDPRGKSQLKERQKEKCVKEEAACKSKGSHKGMKSRKQDRSKERDVERHHPSSSSRSTPPRLRTPDYPLDDAIPDREEELGKKARQHGHRYGSRHGKDRHYHPSSPSPQPKSFTRKRYYYSPPPPKGDRRRSRRSPVDGHPQHRYYSRSPPYHGSPPPMYRVRSSRGGSPPHRSAGADKGKPGGISPGQLNSILGFQQGPPLHFIYYTLLMLSQVSYPQGTCFQTPL